jgi:uncharacterized protein (TIRG00374 family)
MESTQHWRRLAGSPWRIIGFALVVAFGAWCMISLRADLARASLVPVWRAWDRLLLALGLSMVNYGLRVVRWRWYLRILKHPLKLRFAILTYIAGLAFTLSPGKLGEVARARYYIAIGIPLRDVTGALFTERLMDVLAVLALMTLTSVPIPHYSQILIAATGLIAFIVTLVSTLPWDALSVRLRLSRLPASVAKASSEVANTFASAHSLLRVRSTVLGLLLALAAWASEGLALKVLSSIFVPPHIGAMLAIGIYNFALLVGAVSFLPGGLGSTEAVMTKMLVAQGHTIENALIITLACRIATLWFGIALGLIAVATLRRRPRMS